MLLNIVDDEPPSPVVAGSTPPALSGRKVPAKRAPAAGGSKGERNVGKAPASRQVNNSKPARGPQSQSAGQKRPRQAAAPKPPAKAPETEAAHEPLHPTPRPQAKRSKPTDQRTAATAATAAKPEATEAAAQPAAPGKKSEAATKPAKPERPAKQTGPAEPATPAKASPKARGDAVVTVCKPGKVPAAQKGTAKALEPAKNVSAAKRPIESAADTPAAKRPKNAAKEPADAPAAGLLSFKALGLCDKLLNVLTTPSVEGGMGFSVPTLVQQNAIPHILQGRDVLIRSETGSGKTLAFGLPMLELLQQGGSVSRADGISALVLSPTRELCFQITQVLEKVARPFFWVVIGALVGGEKRKSEKARLRKGINILVATPGRLLDHLEHTETLGSSLKRGMLRWLVLDEADRLTDAGFVKQIGAVLEWLETNGCTSGGDSASKRRLQTVLVSATLNSKVQELASRSLHEPETVEIKTGQSKLHAAPAPTLEPGEAGPAQIPGSDTAGDHDSAGENAAAAAEDQELSMPKTLTQHYMLVPSKDRLVALSAFVLRQVKRYRYSVKIVLFVSCRAVVDFLHAAMSRVEWPPRRNGRKAERPRNQGLGTRWWKLHGSVDQKERRRAINEFSKAKNGVLICTDVAARGLDLPHVDWIIQYDPPSEVSEYVHRVGRTARSGRRGSALLFLTPSEEEYVKLLEARQATLVEIKVQTMYAALSKYAVQEDENAEAEAELDALIGLAPSSGSAARGPGARRRSQGAGKVSALGRAAQDPEAAAALMHLKLIDLVEGDEDEPADAEQAESAAGAAADAPAVAKAKDAKAAKKRPGAGAAGSKARKSVLKIKAEEAFVAFVRAYAVHSKETKLIFHPKKLHLGHVARSFGLKEEPKGVSQASRVRHKERKVKREGHRVKRDFTRKAEQLTKGSASEFAAS